MGEQMPALSRFVSELKHRRVFRVVAAYAIVAWVLIEVASVIFPALEMPAWSLRLVILLALLGLPVALVLAWAIQLEPTDPSRTIDAEAGAPATSAGSARAGRLASFALGMVVVLVAAAGVYIVGQPLSDTPEGVAFRTATAGMSALTQLTFSAGVEEYPAFAADGDRLAYVREVDGYRQIFVRSLPTAQETQLTNDSVDHIQPAWSPDGRVLLYVRAAEPGTKLEPLDVFDSFVGGEIWRLELATRERRRILKDAYDPAYAPDGSRIAFDASWGGPRRIWVADSLGQNARQVTTADSEADSHIAPAWSPDGRAIVFQNIEKTKFDIRLVEVESGAMTWLTDDPFPDIDPVWSFDGREVFFSSPRGGGMNLWRISVDKDGSPAGPPHQITTGAGQDVNVTVAPGGGRVAFTILSQNADLWRLPVEPETGMPTGAPEPVIVTTREESRGAASPDGRRLAFNSDRRGEMNLWLYTPEDGTTQQLTSGSGGDYQPRWSPDGRTLVFFSSRSGNADIWTVEVASGQLRQLTADPGLDVNPFYSPDGRWIAFQSDRGGRKDLWVMASDGSDHRQLTTDAVLDHFIPWTPDSRSLLVKVPGEGARQVFLDGSPSRELPEIRSAAHMSLSPDGRLIIDVEGHRTLNVAPVDGGPPRRAFEFEDSDVRIDYPTWSPDGEWVIFDRHRPTAGDIWLLDLRGLTRPAT